MPATPKPLIDVRPDHWAIVRDILQKHVPQYEVWAFGSRAKWMAKEYSDLDLAVITDRPLSLSLSASLADDFSESDLPWKVDVVDWATTSASFREIIERDKVVVQKPSVGRARTSVIRRAAGEASKDLGMAGEAPIEHDLRWPVVSLAEIATKIGSGATPTGGADAYIPNRTRFALVRSQNVFDRRFDHDGLAFITDEQADGLRGVVLEHNDVLLNITGDGITFGRACIVPKDVLPACVNQHVSIIRLDSRRADAGYVLAFLTHPEVKSYIESFNAGGSRRAITKGHIESFRLPLPPLPEQHAIAHILGTLDDKIELNRRMNETLEAMARALFKSWFVDFDPVRAKLEGRDPGLPKPLADLFPDSFEDSELGEIPKGWEVKRLSELCSTQYGYTASAVPEPVGPKFIRVMDINKRNWIEWANVPHCQIDAEAKTDYALQRGDIVVARMADPGKSAIIEDDIDAVFASYLVRLKTKSLGHSYFVYGFLKSNAYLEYAQGAKSGSVQANMNARVIVGADMVVPSPFVIERFLESILPFRKRLAESVRESRTLAALRDTLLPKLISGELRVKDAAAFRGGPA